MAVVRNYVDSDNPISYVATAAFFCSVSCVVIMLFRGFRARINVASKSTKDDSVPVVCISGAYRVNREEFFESSSSRIAEPPKKITPSMVNLPPNNNSLPSIKPSQSTSDVREPGFVPVTVSKSTPEISFDPRGGKNSIAEVELRRPAKSPKELKKEEKEKVKLEKKRQAEQKAREKAAQKLAQQEQAKREREQAKQAKQVNARDKKGKKTKTAAPPAPPAPPVPQSAAPQTSTAPTPPIRQGLSPTNSLQSDINRSSGPPPYLELPPEPTNKRPGQPANVENAGTSNVSFGKPIDNTSSSWDMVTQHRQQMSRPTATIGGGARKQVVMDLQYNFNNKSNVDKDNSEA